MSATEPRAEGPRADGPLSQRVLDYNLVFKRLVDQAKTPGFSLADWAPLAAFVATDAFERVGSFKEVVTWDQYIGMVHDWATGSHWESSFRGITQAGRRVFLELEERIATGEARDTVNSLTVWEFDADDKLCHLDIYLQQAPQPQWASGWKLEQA